MLVGKPPTSTTGINNRHLCSPEKARANKHIAGRVKMSKLFFKNSVNEKQMTAFYLYLKAIP